MEEGDNMKEDSSWRRGKRRRRRRKRRRRRRHLFHIIINRMFSSRNYGFGWKKAV